MPRVLVLGTGQVGTFAAGAIAQSGASVVAADLNPAPGYFARYGPKEAVELLTVNVLDARAITKVIKSYAVDVIVLTAGLTGKASASNPEKAWLVNVRSAETVGLAALENGVRRLVFMSTFAVYGRPPVRRISEATPTRPESEYGRSKLAAEAAVTRLRDEGLDVRIIRPCGTYGPLRLGMGSQSARVFESLLFGAARNVKLKVQASPITADEYIYVKDLGRAVALAALNDTDSPEFIFNVGSGRKTTARELCRTVRRMIPGASVGIESVAPETSQPMAPLDVSLVRETFGFTPFFDLAAGIDDYLHEAGLKS